MPASDILNPTPTHPLNPDYGWQRKRPITHIVTKANMGSPYYREMTDVEHQFLLNWGITGAEREYHEVSKLKWYYEQYRDGLFTLIDHEGDGRHYVGRFTSPVEPVPVGHNRWSVQQVLFEEVPGATPLRWPGRWRDDIHGKSPAIWRTVVSDFGEMKVAVNDPSAWRLAAESHQPGGYILRHDAETSGDWLQMSYMGYGFQLYCAMNSALGLASLSLDGYPLGTVDQYSADATYLAMAREMTTVPLGLHTVQLTTLGAKNPLSSGYIISFSGLRVMR